MGAVRHACEKCEQGGSCTSQIHRNERRFDSLSGKFDAASSASRAGSTLISVSLASVKAKPGFEKLASATLTPDVVETIYMPKFR
ncbi:hypothetical protein, partial [Burkholderia cenocepacia]|uniref:hypothetical protein n=1 Tax=Burkholderia cenocepacia TaxID=95486 RepID=UPI001B92B7F3